MDSSALRRRSRSRLAAALAGALLLLVAGAPPVFAQQDTPPPAPAGEAAAQAAPADPVAGRISRLEEQIGDLQVMIGTLESLVKSKPDAVLPQESVSGGDAPGVSNAAGLTSRVDALETQIGALTSQLELMTQQLGALEAKLGGAGAPQPLLPPRDAEPLPSEPPGRQGLAPAEPSPAALADAGADGPQVRPFGTTTISTAPEAASRSPEEDDAAGNPVPDPGAQEQPGQPAEDQPQSLAALPQGVDAVSLYNQGYGDLMRRDYAAAETSFHQLVTRFPDDPLAGKAQYWLGETYYVRGQFKIAADAFLKGYKKYKSGEKAPDSLLKLGMALAELGQKDAACSTFSEFSTKFPTADEHLRDQAKSERRRAGC